MTAIAGVIDESTKSVWIGGDSAGVDGYFSHARKDPKVFQVGPFLCGFTSSFRMGNVLRFGDGSHTLSDKSLLYGTEDMDPFEIVVTKLVPWFRQRFKDSGFARKKDEEEYGGTFLLGFRGRLFEIEEDYQVSESIQPYAACGCGRELVLGSLHTTQDFTVTSERRLQKALEAAAEFSCGVRPPFTILKLTEETDHSGSS